MKQIEFKPELTTNGSELLIREELGGTATAIVPGGVRISGEDPQLPWRFGHWQSRDEAIMSAPALAVNTIKLIEVIQGYPQWADWVLKSATSHLEGMTKYYKRSLDAGSEGCAAFILEELREAADYVAENIGSVSTENAMRTIVYCEAIIKQ